MTYEKIIRPSKIGKPSLANFIFLITVGVLFTWSIVISIFNPTIFHLNYMMVFIKIFCMVGTFGLIFSSKHLMRVAIVFFVVSFILIISDFFLTFEYLNMINQITELLTNTFQFIIGQSFHTDLYEMIAIWTICITVSLFAVMFIYFRFQFLILFTISTIIFSVSITSPYFSYTPAFSTFIFSLLVLLIRYLHHKNAQKEVDPTPFTKYAYILLIISLLIASSLPKPKEGFTQNAILVPFEAINDIIADLTQPSEFSLQQVGFGNSGRLGGDITLNNDLFMRIRPASRELIYLTGAIMDTYTGYSWINNFHETEYINFDDGYMSLEMIEYLLSVPFFGFWQLSKNPIERFILSENQEYFEHDPFFQDSVTGMEMSVWEIDEQPWNLNWDLNHNLTTMYIDVLNARPTFAFHTGIVHNISAQNVDDFPFSRYLEGHSFANRRMPINTIYKVSYVEPMIHQALWFNDGAKLVEMSNRGLFNDIHNFITTFHEIHDYNVFEVIIDHENTAISFKELLNDYLIPRTEQIYVTHTTLPDKFPKRVHELALEITETASSNYEQMRLLEAYLSENFTYTLTPGPSSQEQDFVDYFLFESKKGYCVHFATAFATMARSLGMPTRYVEGFLVPTDISNRQLDDEGVFIDVLNSMAHAWPEVYFEGVGWVRFEPTPSSGLPQSQHTSEVNQNEHEGIPNIMNEDYSESQESLDNQPEDEDRDITIPEYENGNEQIEVDGTLNDGSWLLLGIGVVFILVIVRVAFVYIKRKKLIYKENNEAVIYLFSTILSYLKVFKIEIKKEETAQQFITHTCSEFFNDDYMQRLLKEFADVFAKARYSDFSISDEERQIVEKVVYTIDERMRESNRWKYFYRFYILIKH